MAHGVVSSQLVYQETACRFAHFISLMAYRGKFRLDVIGMAFVGIAYQGDILRNAQAVAIDDFMAAKAKVSFIAKMASGGLGRAS